MNGVTNNPILGRPWVVVAANRVRYSVFVLAHCRSLAEAKDTVDEMDNHTTVGYVICGAPVLKETLKQLRDHQATRMARDFMVAA